MGFRVKSFIITAGSSDFPTGNTDALRPSLKQSGRPKSISMAVKKNFKDAGYRLSGIGNTFRRFAKEVLP